MATIIQQGDVIWHTENKKPTGCKQIVPKNGRLVFAEGEVSGHMHSVADDCGVKLYQDKDGTLWCSVTNLEGATVEHQEHKSVHLDKGTYRIGIVREVDPFSEEVRQVRD